MIVDLNYAAAIGKGHSTSVVCFRYLLIIPLTN